MLDRHPWLPGNTARAAIKNTAADFMSLIVSLTAHPLGNVEITPQKSVLIPQHLLFVALLDYFFPLASFSLLVDVA